jgi:hypothetical protein
MPSVYAISGTSHARHATPNETSAVKRSRHAQHRDMHEQHRQNRDRELRTPADRRRTDDPEPERRAPRAEPQREREQRDAPHRTTRASRDEHRRREVEQRRAEDADCASFAIARNAIASIMKPSTVANAFSAMSAQNASPNNGWTSFAVTMNSGYPGGGGKCFSGSYRSTPIANRFSSYSQIVIGSDVR